MWQPDGSTVIPSGELSLPFASGFATYTEVACGDFSRIVECRRIAATGGEIVTFEIDIGLPQRPVYAINATETVSVCFWATNARAPLIAVGRIDFPDTPHQGFVRAGFPSVLCIDDRPWQDVRAEYTSSELMGRISIWFTKATEGDLHGDDQPFESFFFEGFGPQLILTKDGETALITGGNLHVRATDDDVKFLLATASTDGTKDGAVGLSVIQASVEPQRMARIRHAPANLKELIDLLDERGIDLSELLKAEALEWAASERNNRGRTWLVCLLISMPQIHPLSGEIGATRPMAFYCNVNPGEVGVGLGILARNMTGEGTFNGYLRLLQPEAQTLSLENIAVDIAHVHVELDASRAAMMAGHQSSDARHLVMIGAGSLGSNIAEQLTREGLFKWTVLDHDTFLPHNVVRHTLTRHAAGRPKAPQVAARMHALRSDASAEAFVVNDLPLNCHPAAIRASAISVTP